MIDQINMFAEKNLANLHIPSIHIADIVEILIISFIMYHVLVWLRSTRAWSLLRGVFIIMVCILLAAIFEMNTILWIVKSAFSIVITAIIIALQPELRRALEDLGRNRMLSGLFTFELTKESKGIFSDKTIKEISRACVSMGKAKTGALIVVKQTDNLDDYEQTGITIDAVVTSQLLINIFEKNTPLHDGAVIINNDRVSSATCYLPLSSNNNLSKELGTRHRAAIGMSEDTDALILVVSEETGAISVAYRGQLTRNLSSEDIEIKLAGIQNKPRVVKKRVFTKGRVTKDEE